jgi:APA family basic amino acid/polyamine antiporter
MAALAALFAYDGWNAVSLVAGEIEQPVRVLPRALVLGLGLVMVLYLTTTTAYVVSLGPAAAAGSTQLAADVGKQVLGALGERMMAGLIALSTFGTVLGMMLTCPRTYYAMAVDGVFFAVVGRVHPRWGTPHVAVLLQTVWALCLVHGATFGKLLDYVMFVSWLFYSLTAGSLFVLRGRRRGQAGPFATPGYPYTPLVFMVVSAFLSFDFFLVKPWDALRGIGMMAAGVPLYFLVCRPAAPPPQPPSREATDSSRLE